ncbi:right-handed parallel beta-helix repeat-containing protein, partial [bacterium]|nr:right-handed parallel beta-helix repeat-containing protein [candidate division CSSED10-310 bacterium]
STSSHDPIISNNIITENCAVRSGGGISYGSGSCQIINNLISDNVSEDMCGGLGGSGSPLIFNNIVSGNKATNYAGGMKLTGSPVVANCLITDNICGVRGSAIYFSNTSKGSVVNCTISGNLGSVSGIPVVASYDASPEFYNCILWNESVPEVSASSSYPTNPAFPYIHYCDVQDGYPGTGNIDAHPLYADGPLGSYYLSHTEAGQATTSPCVDAGRKDASEICFDLPSGRTCLNEWTTRTDEVKDTGQTDMGFHYSFYEPPGVDLLLNDTMFEAGEPFKLRAYCVGTDNVSEADLYVALEVFGQFWFWPDWQQIPSHKRIDLTSGSVHYYFILDFTWPDGEFGSIDGLNFWGAMFDPVDGELIGNYDKVTFGYR